MALSVKHTHFYRGISEEALNWCNALFKVSPIDYNLMNLKGWISTFNELKKVIKHRMIDSM